MKPDIEEIKRRADAATQGPWHISGDIRHLVFPPDSYRSELPLPIIAKCDGIHFADTKKHIAKIQANARFIAEARTDIPALLDYIAKLEAENERLTKELDSANESNKRLDEECRMLINERDAAVNDIRWLDKNSGCCYRCKSWNGKRCKRGYSVNASFCNDWQWRGLRKGGCVMKAREGYAKYMEWDRIAAEQKIATEWCETVGEAVGNYLNECIMYGHTPTFDGFFKHLEAKAPKEAHDANG